MVNYGTIYTLPFKSRKEVSYLIEIQKENYTGDSVDLVGSGSSPFSVSIEDEDFLYIPTRFSKAVIRVVGGDYLQSLYSTGYQQYRVNFKRENNIVWTGFVKPELYTQDYTSTKFEITSETTAESASESETASEAAERPDYKALDYVKLGDYKGLEVTLASTDVTDEEVEQQVETNLNNNDKSEELKEGTVENGDVANIDYEGKLNGKAFDGGTAEGYDLTIGSGSFIDGFEDGLIGKKIGDTVDLNLTFPEDYSSTDLAGKEVVFTVKINSVKRAPKLTDELAAEISNNEYKTAEAYNNYIKEDLENTKKENQHNQELNDLVALAYQNATVNDYPQEMIDYQLEQVTSYYKSYADQYGMEYADFLEQQVGMTEEEFVKKMTETVKQSLGQEMVLRAIAETEGVEISDEKFQEKASKYAAQMGSTDVDAFISQYGKSTIMASILQDEAVEILEKNAVVKNADGTLAETTAETETETASK